MLENRDYWSDLLRLANPSRMPLRGIRADLRQVGVNVGVGSRPAPGLVDEGPTSTEADPRCRQALLVTLIALMIGRVFWIFTMAHLPPAGIG